MSTQPRPAQIMSGPLFWFGIACCGMAAIFFVIAAIARGSMHWTQWLQIIGTGTLAMSMFVMRTRLKLGLCLMFASSFANVTAAIGMFLKP